MFIIASLPKMSTIILVQMHSHQSPDPSSKLWCSLHRNHTWLCPRNPRQSLPRTPSLPLLNIMLVSYTSPRKMGVAFGQHPVSKLVCPASHPHVNAIGSEHVRVGTRAHFLAIHALATMLRGIPKLQVSALPALLEAHTL